MRYAVIFGFHRVISGPIFKDHRGILRFVFCGRSIYEVANGNEIIIIEA